MLKLLQGLNPLVLLIVATVCEVGGDAIIRMALYDHAGPARIALLATGAALLFCYGSLLNLGPIEFGRVVGLYIATLFVVWQIINFVAFRATPTLPIVVGGALIVCGGVVITYWRPT